MKALYVPETDAEAFAAMTDLELKWKSRKFDQAKLDEIIETYGLSEADAKSLAVAVSMRGKKVLLAESEAALAAAQDFEVPAASYEELVEVLSADEAPNVPMTPKAVDVE